MVEREEPAASTAMFQSFAKRRDAEGPTKSRLPMVVVAVAAVVVVAAVAAWLLLG